MLGGGVSRGMFIVFEGIDRSGKSSQVKRLLERFKEKNIAAVDVTFPDRSTPIGQLIDFYLKGGKPDISAEGLHLLFSANRWEKQSFIKDQLLSGVSVVCDRYAFSGTAYSVGAKHLDEGWCMTADRGLIAPDVILQLDVHPDTCIGRGNYGDEIFERLDLQLAVRNVFRIYHKLNNWEVISLGGEIGHERDKDDKQIDQAKKEKKQERYENGTTPDVEAVHQKVVSRLQKYFNKFNVCLGDESQTSRDVQEVPKQIPFECLWDGFK